MTFELPWWKRLSVRLGAVVALSVVVTIGIFVAAAVRLQQDHLVGEAVRSAVLLSETIRTSTHNYMLRDEKADAYRVMEDVGRLDDVERVRIFNKEGKVTFSTDHQETGTFVDKNAESCYACHAADRPIVRPTVSSRTRIFEASGHRVLGMVAPIYNEAACSSAECHVHPEGQRVLGVVDVAISLAQFDAGIASLRRKILWVSAAIVLVLFSFVHFTARRLVLRPVRALLVATRKVARGEPLEAVPVRGDDEMAMLALSFNRMREALAKADAEIQGLLTGLEHQVEERTAALRSAQAQLVQGEKLASLGKLSASIAHEINNPLAGILTFTKLLIRNLSDGGGDDDARASAIKHLQLVQRETERCSAIVRNLLDFARQRPVALKEVDLNAALEESLQLVGHQVALQGIELVKSLEGKPTVWADFGQLRQAFVNILLNAVDAMSKGGTLSVSTRPLPGGRSVELVFRDTGHGIPEEIAGKIFDPFFTTKEKGTGLGLSVVYGIVQRLGGDVEVRSKVGEGTAIVMRLPFAEASPVRNAPDPVATAT